MRIINLVIIFILLSLILPDATTADSAECEKAVKLADEGRFKNIRVIYERKYEQAADISEITDRIKYFPDMPPSLQTQDLLNMHRKIIGMKNIPYDPENIMALNKLADELSIRGMNEYYDIIKIRNNLINKFIGSDNLITPGEYITKYDPVKGIIEFPVIEKTAQKGIQLTSINKEVKYLAKITDKTYIVKYKGINYIIDGKRIIPIYPEQDITKIVGLFKNIKGINLPYNEIKTIKTNRGTFEYLLIKHNEKEYYVVERGLNFDVMDKKRFNEYID